MNSSQDDKWVDDIVKWADENKIPELNSNGHKFDTSGRVGGLPRNKDALLNLEEFSLWHIKINTLPKGIGNLLNLKIMDILGTGLSELPKEIGELKNLTSLKLDTTNLVQLPDEICNLTGLRKLYLEGKKIDFTDSQDEWISELKKNGCIVKTKQF